ncbi:MAG: TonB-dependent receptor [Desulfobacteraceae bacterium]|nr:MAG: TonB-dependent receptor [Desulfobacteraceae bacterium]
MFRLLQMLFVGMAIGLAMHTPARSTPNPAAEIVSITGVGHYRPNEIKPWSDARVNQDLYGGNYVRTGRLSRMGILFGDNTQIRLNQKTLLRVKSTDPPDAPKRKTILRLDRGRVWTQTKDIPKGLIMETPSATAAIRGTEWDLEVDEKGTATITVLKGEVVFYNDYGRVVVQPSEQARAEVGKAPVKIMVVRPKDRVQWVTAYAAEPLYHIIFYPGTLTELKQRLRRPLKNTADGFAELGMILAAMGRWKEATSRFAAAVEKDKDHQKALLGLAYAALQNRETRQAGQFLKQVKPQASTRELSALARASVHILDQEQTAAIEVLDLLIRQTSLSGPAPYLILSDLMITNGDIQQALQQVQDAIARFPQSAAAYSQLARVYLISDRPSRVKDALQQAFENDSDAYDALLVQGEFHRIQGNAKAARLAYERAIALKPHDDRAWYGLGVIRSEQAYVSDARQSLTKALELNPHGYGYSGEMGTLQSFTDHFKAAQSSFSKALEQNPSDYVALTGQGVMLLKQGATEEALQAFLRAGIMEPGYARARLYIGVAYYQLGRVSQAMEELDRVSELDDKDPMPYMLKAIIYNDLLQPAKAVASARKALELMPYLKSLNQLANTRRGTTNLGQAFAFMGMEDWARMYANESYSPYWAGSHLFLADRYSGLFLKNSELFQGFLSDPTVFGSDTRFQTLTRKPGHNFTASYRRSESSLLSGVYPLFEGSGYGNAYVPSAYYLGYEAHDHDFDYIQIDFNAATMALGAKPSHHLGLFGFVDHSNYDRTYTATRGGNRLDLAEELTTDRFDFGASYKLSPVSQLWFKAGEFSYDEYFDFDFFNLTLDIHIPSDMGVDVNSPELAFRHTFNLFDVHEISYGLDVAHRETSVHLEQSDPLDAAFWREPVYDVIHQEYSEKSRDFYISDRVRLSPDLLIQADLFYQWHQRRVHEDYYWWFPLRPGDVIDFGDQDDAFSHRQVSPRLGLVYRVKPGALVRMAYQNWIRPSSQGTLGPVATAGIPLEDQMVLRGGELKRYCARLEWEATPKTFFSADVDYKMIDNHLFSVRLPFSIGDLDHLSKLGSRDLGSLTRETLHEFTSLLSYEAGTIKSCSVSFNHLLTDRWGLSGKYIYTSSENTGQRYPGNAVPFLPRHTAVLGATWTDPGGWYVVSRLVYRSDRFEDEANTLELTSGVSGSADIYWQSSDKSWLFRVSADRAFDENNSTQYTAEVTLRY